MAEAKRQRFLTVYDLAIGDSPVRLSRCPPLSLIVVLPPFCVVILSAIEVRKSRRQPALKTDAKNRKAPRANHPRGFFQPSPGSKRTWRLAARNSAGNYLPPTLCSVVHLPSTTLYSVMPPFFRSPFASYARCAAVTAGMSVFASTGRYFAGSVEFAFFIAAKSAIAPSYAYGEYVCTSSLKRFLYFATYSLPPGISLIGRPASDATVPFAASPAIDRKVGVLTISPAISGAFMPSDFICLTIGAACESAPP